MAIKIPIGCQVEPLTEVTFLGGGALGEEWKDVDIDSGIIIIDTTDPAILALKSDKLILATIRSALVDSETASEIAFDELKFAIRL